jgi:hypothetical protein
VCLQLLQAEGFGDVVIHSELQARRLVCFLGSGGEHDDGNARDLADVATSFPPIELWHHHVQDDDIWPVPRDLEQGRVAIRGGVHLIAVPAEVEVESLQQGGIVVN